MVAKLEGQVEQPVNVLRQDQTLRAKMVVAIEKIINKKSSKRYLNTLINTVYEELRKGEEVS